MIVICVALWLVVGCVWFGFVLLLFRFVLVSLFWLFTLWLLGFDSVVLVVMVLLPACLMSNWWGLYCACGVLGFM